LPRRLALAPVKIRFPPPRSTIGRAALDDLEAAQCMLTPVAFEMLFTDLQEWRRSVTSRVVHRDSQRRQRLGGGYEALRVGREGGVVDGRQPAGLSALQIRQSGTPLAWADQQTALGF
jgi:hypothetical protein